MLEKSTDKLEINTRNPKDSQTIYGTLFYHSSLKFYVDQGYKPKEKLE